MITQLLFEHSLRIRVVAKEQDSEDAPKINVAGPAGPLSTIQVDTNDGTSSDNVVGKINNLIPTDIGNIADAKDFLFIFVYIPLQATLCVIFLYSILGWRWALNLTHSRWQLTC